MCDTRRDYRVPSEYVAKSVGEPLYVVVIVVDTEPDPETIGAVISDNLPLVEGLVDLPGVIGPVGEEVAPFDSAWWYQLPRGDSRLEE